MVLCPELDDSSEIPTSRIRVAGGCLARKRLPQVLFLHQTYCCLMACPSRVPFTNMPQPQYGQTSAGLPDTCIGGLSPDAICASVRRSRIDCPLGYSRPEPPWPGVRS